MKTIAVVVKYKQIFDYYVRNNPEPDTEYVFINSEDKIVGREFDEMKVIFGYEQVDNLNDLIELIKCRIRK